MERTGGALSPLMLDACIHRALSEDLGRAGDLTTDSIVASEQQAEAVIRARSEGCIAGLQFAHRTFNVLDPALAFTPECSDGQDVVAGAIVGALLWVFFVAFLGRYDPLTCSRVAGPSLPIFAVGGGLIALFLWGRRTPGQAVPTKREL